MARDAEETDYRAKATEDAWDMVAEFVDEMGDQWESDGKVSDDYNNDYNRGDEYHHSTHVDKDYDLQEAAALLDQLDEYEETDNGLWDGQEPRRAIATQAAFTYGNAVGSIWSGIINDLNDDLDELREEMEAEEPPTFEGDDADEQLEDWKDAREERIILAGKRLINVFAILRERPETEYQGLVGVALDSLKAGEFTPVLVLADAVDGGDGGEADSRLARDLRLAVNSVK